VSQFVDASRLNLGDYPANSSNLAQAATVPYGLGFHGSSYQLNRVSFRHKKSIALH
jgi:hypothetical protein